MASKAPSRVETPKVGTAPLKGAKMAIFISFCAGAAGVPQAANIMLAITSTEKTANKRLVIS
jgi:hypothetical protein